MDKNLWGSYFSQDQFPAFSCPRCNNGVLRLEKKSFNRATPKYVPSMNDPDWDPGRELSRFVGFMECSRSDCGEIVCVAGKIEVIESYEDDGNQTTSDVLSPTSIFPAPHVIAFSEKLHRKPKAQLLKAFELLWVDTSASANRLRICVELLLNQLKVPRFNKPKAGKKRARLDLATRIAKLKGTKASQTHILNALRVVGNVGSHDGEIDRDLLLTAFSLMEDVLAELLDNHTANRDAMARNIIAAKGKMP